MYPLYILDLAKLRQINQSYVKKCGPCLVLDRTIYLNPPESIQIYPYIYTNYPYKYKAVDAYSNLNK